MNQMLRTDCFLFEFNAIEGMAGFFPVLERSIWREA